MSDINWDDNALAAVREFHEWVVGELLMINQNVVDEFIATRPTQDKTVKDAVEVFPDGWPSDDYHYLYHSLNRSSGGWMWSVNEWNVDGFYKVCTREQFEACAAKKGEKWTHTWNGRKCKVVFTEGCKSWVKGEGLDKLVPTDSLKPIKPKLTKAQAWDMVSGDQSGSVWALKIKYDIIDF